MDKKLEESILDRLQKIEEMIEYLGETLKDISRRLAQIEEIV